MGIDTGTIAVVAPLVAIAVVGVLVLARMRRAGGGRSQAAGWPRTMGTVLSSTVQVSPAGGSRHETPLVLYAYQVDGQVFQGSRVRVAASANGNSNGGGNGSASATVARYPAGSSVVVFFDPANPANSALEV